MTAPIYRSGDFVWSNSPKRENPARPGLRHIGYIAVSTNAGDGNAAVLAYTTTRPPPDKMPLGMIRFDRQEAKTMGQNKPFTLDLRRLAFVPATADWFPDIGSPGNGIVGHAPESRRLGIEKTLKDLAERRLEIIEKLGPMWGRG